MKNTKNGLNEDELRKLIQKHLKESKLEDIGQVGNTGIYYLGSGTYTGKSGWELFKQELKNQALNEK